MDSEGNEGREQPARLRWGMLEADEEALALFLNLSGLSQLD